MKKLWNFVTTAVLIVLLSLVAIMYVPKFMGFNPMIVLSGSMEPTYHVGSLLYVKGTDTDKIKVGDPITFYLDDNETLVTHRVIKIDEETKAFYTQGDANEVEDGSAISPDKVLGVPVFNIPKIGYVADKISGMSGKIMYVTIIVAVLILMLMGDVIWSDDKKAKETENEDVNQEKN